MNRPRTKIAIQKSGRLNKASMDFLFSLGLEFSENSNSLIRTCTNYPLDVLYLRDDDIPEYVARGVATVGIVGENILQEKKFNSQQVRKLGFARCSLTIAVPEKSPILTLEDLEGERIATTYPAILSEFLAKKSISAAIIPISGSVEITPELNLADAICDLVQTGSTLRAHNLSPLATVLESEAVLIASPFQDSARQELLERLSSTKI